MRFASLRSALRGPPTAGLGGCQGFHDDTRSREPLLSSAERFDRRFAMRVVQHGCQRHATIFGQQNQRPRSSSILTFTQCAEPPGRYGEPSTWPNKSYSAAISSSASRRCGKNVDLEKLAKKLDVIEPWETRGNASGNRRQAFNLLGQEFESLRARHKINDLS
jgi:hypothetical protein